MHYLTQVLTERPRAGEVPEYFLRYTDQVGPGDVRDVLEAQGREALAKLRALPADRSTYAYAPGKWTLAEVVAHMSDTERVFAYRAFWFARALEGALPGFDQDAGALTAGADQTAWPDLLGEFEAVRAATTTLLRGLPSEAWARIGTANQTQYSVKALAFIMAGHVAHHMRLVDELYVGR
ncbi:MAG: DinB family protein [Trueperaceae bacterium]|nr:DinB family protein [Trueperaceae bacterium]